MCTIEICDVANAPEYIAISYTWGAPQPLSQNLVDGRTFLVRQNCLCALLQARLQGSADDLLWLDSICINQNDMQEKSAQVAMMGDLFEQDKVVFSCIGEMTDNTAFLFRDL